MSREQRALEEELLRGLLAAEVRASLLWEPMRVHFCFAQVLLKQRNKETNLERRFRFHLHSGRSGMAASIIWQIFSGVSEVQNYLRWHLIQW